MAKWNTMFDERVELHPPVDPKELARIPAKRGVVLLQAAHAVPISLITSADLRSCVRNRLFRPSETVTPARADLRSITRWVCWKLASSWFENDLSYFELARSIWPDRYTKLLSWRCAWFVHVGEADEYPYFRATREVFARQGRYFGPFVTARSAQRFIEAVQDLFDLCRDHKLLAKSPGADPCSYGQMGRCLRPCDGTICMERYREVVGDAADFAGGNRTQLQESLAGKMALASEALEFEAAGGIKSRIQRIGQFDLPEYRYVAAAELLQFILIQPGPTRRKAKVFLVDRGWITPCRVLDYPLQEAQLGDIVQRMADWAGADRVFGSAERWRLGLVVRYLFSALQRGGLILRWRPQMHPEQLGRAIEQVRDRLKLRAPKQPGRKGSAKRTRR